MKLIMEEYGGYIIAAAVVIGLAVVVNALMKGDGTVAKQFSDLVTNIGNGLTTKVN